MKFYYFFFITQLLFFVFTPTNAMENNNNTVADMLYIANFVKLGKITKAIFSHKKNEAIITSLQFCWIYDFFTKKTINIIPYKFDEPVRSIKINPKNNLIAIQQLSLEILDITQKKIVWKKDIHFQESALAFSAKRDTVFYTKNSNKLIENDLITNTNKEFNTQSSNFLASPSITPHKTEEKFFLWRKDPAATLCLKSFCPNKKDCTENVYIFPKTKMIYICQCVHINDEYLAIVEKNNTISIINIKNKTYKHLPISSHKKNSLQAEPTIVSIPFSFSIAIHFDKDHEITFWHAKTQTFTCSINLKNLLKHCPNNRSFFKLLNFSSQGKELLLSLGETIFVLKVPLHALYQFNTVNSSIFALWILNSFLYDKANRTPGDINRLIIHYFFMLSK